MIVSYEQRVVVLVQQQCDRPRISELSGHAMTGSSMPNVVIVVVVIIRDCVEELASPPTTAGRPAETRTRHEHAQADSGQPPDTYPSRPDDTEGCAGQE